MSFFSNVTIYILILFYFNVLISCDIRLHISFSRNYISMPQQLLNLSNICSGDENRYIEHSKEVFSDYIKEWFENHYVISAAVILPISLLANEFSSRRCLSIIYLLLVADVFFMRFLFYNQKLKENYSTSYIRKMHQLLSLAFSQAVKWKKIAFNPVTDADPPAVKYKEISIWSIQEIQDFLDNCKGEQHYLTFLLAIYTGMRRGEILGLQWSDIDFQQKVIHVRRSLAYVPRNGYFCNA